MVFKPGNVCQKVDAKKQILYTVCQNTHAKNQMQRNVNMISQVTKTRRESHEI